MILGILAGPLKAQNIGDVTAWSGISTFGLSFEGGYQMTPDWRARAGWMGGLQLNETQTESGNSYDIDAALGAMTMIVDYSPVDADWRISGGLVFSRTSIETTISGTASNPIEYDGQSFDSGTATSIAEFNRTAAPLVSVGYDYPINDEWVLSSEIGAVFVGGFDIEITGDSAELQVAIDADPDVQNARADAANFAAYPYINLSVGYRF